MFKLDRAFYIPSAQTFPDVVEQADAESSAVAYLYTGTGGQPVAKMFSGKRAKPDEFVRYQSIERRAAAVQSFFESVRRREAYRVEQREQRKAASKAARGLEIPADGYMSAPAVAAYLRVCLKEAFPGHKFSVTTERSLRVRWTDGPARKDVERIAGTFAGSYFDGMIDYEGAIYHTIDGKDVRFLASYVFCERDMTAEALRIGADALAKSYNTNQQAAAIEDGERVGWSPRITVNPDFPGAIPGQWAGEFNFLPPEIEGECRHSVRAALALELWFDSVQPVAVQPSPTFDRVKIKGTDGYGNTALEAADGGETGRGYPRQPEPEEAPAARAAIGDAERDLFAEFMASRPKVEPAPTVAPEPVEIAKPVACEVIDFAPHLAAHIARADAARRCN